MSDKVAFWKIALRRQGWVEAWVCADRISAYRRRGILAVSDVIVSKDTDEHNNRSDQTDSSERVLITLPY